MLGRSVAMSVPLTPRKPEAIAGTFRTFGRAAGGPTGRRDRVTLVRASTPRPLIMALSGQHLVLRASSTS
ncbi:hypothetical protein ADL17_14290 [Micromonospora maris]|uniref:Uncharacterized protein n=1 Tax=Micromonospora maris TaxID=1003110 RepID=A0A9X0I050_9ACTN|nr:hypothetical protein ADL17_14290 [Micromonospora maris]